MSTTRQLVADPKVLLKGVRDAQGRIAKLQEENEMLKGRLLGLERGTGPAPAPAAQQAPWDGQGPPPPRPGFAPPPASVYAQTDIDDQSFLVLDFGGKGKGGKAGLPPGAPPFPFGAQPASPTATESSMQAYNNPAFVEDSHAQQEAQEWKQMYIDTLKHLRQTKEDLEKERQVGKQLETHLRQLQVGWDDEDHQQHQHRESIEGYHSAPPPSHVAAPPAAQGVAPPTTHGAAPPTAHGEAPPTTHGAALATVNSVTPPTAAATASTTAAVAAALAATAAAAASGPSQSTQRSSHSSLQHPSQQYSPSPGSTPIGASTAHVQGFDDVRGEAGSGGERGEQEGGQAGMPPSAHQQHQIPHEFLQKYRQLGMGHDGEPLPQLKPEKSDVYVLDPEGPSLVTAPSKGPIVFDVRTGVTYTESPTLRTKPSVRMPADNSFSSPTPSTASRGSSFLGKPKRRVEHSVSANMAGARDKKGVSPWMRNLFSCVAIDENATKM